MDTEAQEVENEGKIAALFDGDLPDIGTEEEDEGDAPAAPANESEEKHEEETNESTPKYVVKVQGQESEVTIDELLAGYQRQADYTKKSQELAAQRKEIESKPIPEAFKQQLSKYEQLLGDAVNADRNTDWMRLAKEDPALYVQKRAEAEERDNALKEIQTRRQAEESEKLNEIKSKQMEQLLDKLPTWKDEAVFKEETQKIGQYLQSLGATPEEVNGIIDHRLIVLADKARRFDELQKTKTEISQKLDKAPAKVVRSNTTQGSEGQAVKAAIAKASKSQDDDDIANAISMLLN
jgi:hypothetical protein